MKQNFFLNLSLLIFATSLIHAAQEPVFTNVVVSSQATLDLNGNYHYVYSFTNPAGNTANVNNLTLDTVGIQRPLTLSNTNANWTSLMAKNLKFAIWGVRDTSVSQTAPGTTITGLQLISTAPPQIRSAFVEADLFDYFRLVGQEKRVELNIPPGEEYFDVAFEDQVTARYTLTSQVLGPLSAFPGTYEHWDKTWTDIQTARTLGWLNDQGLYDTVNNHFDAARTASRTQNGFQAQQELQLVIDAIKAATPAQRSDEGYALVYYNALYLKQRSPYPCEPVLTLAPESASHPIGVTHATRATLINRVDGLPIANKQLIFEITEGPNASELGRLTATNVDGIATFAYSSIKTGTDTLSVSIFRPESIRAGDRTNTASDSQPQPARTAAQPDSPTPACSNVNTSRSASVKVTWTGGPDLLVSFFAPPLLKSAPGRTFYITEDTKNRGILAAPQSITRYYLSTTQAIDLSTARVIGQRIVPPLAPGEMNKVFQVPFTVPADLSAGTYYLTACADADRQVLETDEQNNCAHNFLESSVGIVLLEPSSNHPPVANNQSLLAQQGAASPVTLTATDPDGDALTFHVVSGPAHGALSGAAPTLSYTSAADYHGPDSFTFKANDGKVDSNLATVSITVNAPPNCAGGSASPATVLWSPHHDYRAILITGVTDPDGDPVTLRVMGVRQDEPVNGLGDGDTSPDATLNPLQVRAERSGKGDGRVYHIAFTASDNHGGSCTGDVKVCVPHDQGNGSICIDGGPLYDSMAR